MDRRDHLAALDAVRFGCALAVLAYHLLAVFPLAASSVVREFDAALVLPAGLARASWWGWVGVDLFFVVSGYVIAISAARGGAGAFLRRRALRLLPTAWLCATLTAAVLLLGGAMPAAEVAVRWLRSMLLSPLGEPIDPIFWTLGVEVVFYALVATLLRAGADNRGRLLALGAALAAASLAFWAASFAGWLRIDPASTPARLLLLPHGGFFASGIALHALAERRAGRAAGAILAGGLAAGGCEIVALAATMRGVAGFEPNPLAPLALFGAGVAVIACAGRGGSRGGGAGWLTTAGLATYPLYLLNQRFAAGVLVALNGAGLPGWPAVAATAAVVGGLAWLIAVRAEPLVRAWLARQLTPSGVGPGEAAPDAALRHAGRAWRGTS